MGDKIADAARAARLRVEGATLASALLLGIAEATQELATDYANLCGGMGIRVERAEELDEALERAMACHDRPSLIEVMSDQELI